MIIFSRNEKEEGYELAMTKSESKDFLGLEETLLAKEGAGKDLEVIPVRRKVLLNKDEKTLILVRGMIAEQGNRPALNYVLNKLGDKDVTVDKFISNVKNGVYIADEKPLEVKEGEETIKEEEEAIIPEINISLGGGGSSFKPEDDNITEGGVASNLGEFDEPILSVQQQKERDILNAERDPRDPFGGQLITPPVPEVEEVEEIEESPMPLPVEPFEIGEEVFSPINEKEQAEEVGVGIESLKEIKNEGVWEVETIVKEHIACLNDKIGKNTDKVIKVGEEVESKVDTLIDLTIDNSLSKGDLEEFAKDILTQLETEKETITKEDLQDIKQSIINEIKNNQESLLEEGISKTIQSSINGLQEGLTSGILSEIKPILEAFNFQKTDSPKEVSPELREAILNYDMDKRTKDYMIANLGQYYNGVIETNGIKTIPFLSDTVETIDKGFVEFVSRVAPYLLMEYGELKDKIK